VQHLDLRIQEAQRMGFKTFIVSEYARVSSKAGIKKIKNLAEIKNLLWNKAPTQTHVEENF
jgi:predicted ATP-dependent serine protease